VQTTTNMSINEAGSIEKKEFTFDELANHITKSTKIYVSLKGVGTSIFLILTPE
jgi:hypothetical protein